ncbi:MAG: hypothetical protein RL199_721 [Pseudomonadota bacterium]|jgi:hypothetical protein
MRPGIASCLTAVLIACGAPEKAPVTTPDPAAGVFNDTLVVTFQTDVAATVHVTTDGSDPHRSPTALTGKAPLPVTLDHTATVRFYATNGTDEVERTAEYVRAGGKPGSIRGVVAVDSVAVGLPLALLVDGDVKELQPLAQKGEIPFFLENLSAGRHTVRAVADRNGDGRYIAFLDLASDTFTATFDLADPFKASAEEVRLTLGGADQGLCTIAGRVSVPGAKLGEAVRMSAFDAAAFATATSDPLGLLAQLRQGDQLLVGPDRTDYPYAIQNVAPGNYVVVPTLGNIGLGGAGLHLMANPLQAAQCGDGEVVEQDFAFGPAALGGVVTIASSGAGFSYGIVVVKRTELSLSGVKLEAAFMPVWFRTGSDPAKRTGRYQGSGFKANGSYQLRVFESGGAQGPLGAALSWALNPLSNDPAQATVAVGASDTTFDLDLTQP